MYSISDHGADAAGMKLSTAAFQAAVDEAAGNGGGIVYVPHGRYILGTIRLYSDIHIVFEPGSVILGSENLEDDFYPDEHRLTEFYQDNSHSFYHHSLFLAEECENISITGCGKIDMRGIFEKEPRKNDLASNRSVRGAKVIAFRECKNIVLKDFSVYNATDIAVYFGGCENIRINGLYLDVKIDGISPDCCKDVIISDCTVHSGDDGIVLKSSYTLGRNKLCENINICGCIVTSDCNAVKLGTESSGGFRNISVSNCVIYNTHQAAIALECADGGVTDGVNISNITMNNVGCPFIIVLNGRCRAPLGTKPGVMRNITVSQITASGPFCEWKAERCKYWGDGPIFPKQYCSLVAGMREHKIENVTLCDINITVNGGEAKPNDTSVPENDTGYPAHSMFGKSKVYGLFVRHVSGLVMRNVSFHTLDPDEREDIRIEQ